VEKYFIKDFETSVNFRIFIYKQNIMSYYNTTIERDPSLKQFQKEAKRQEDVVLKMFEIYEPQQTKFTKWDMTDLYPTFILPSSVGRCLTDLTKEGKLVKLDEQKRSKYGRSEHYYKLNK
jgi:hypothetical protein